MPIVPAKGAISRDQRLMANIHLGNMIPKNLIKKIWTLGVPLRAGKLACKKKRSKKYTDLERLTPCEFHTPELKESMCHKRILEQGKDLPISGLLLSIMGATLQL